MTTEWPRAEGFSPLSDALLNRWSNFARPPQVVPGESPREPSIWDEVFYPTFLGLRLEEVREDYARMRLPYRSELRQPAGVWHGGAIASLVDTVVVPAVGGVYEEPRQLFTIDMQLRYLAPIAAGDDAVAEGWVTKRGRSTVFCDVEVCGSSRTEIAATATLVYKVSKQRLE